MEWLTDPNIWAALLTLTVLEIVLGIDNIVFISILSGKLPRAQQRLGRRLGLAIALVTRLALLASLSWLIGLTAPLFTTFGHEFSGRDLILAGGGLFLIGKATYEIHDKLEGEDPHTVGRGVASLASVIVQIGLLDMVFSLDSVITAIGMAEHLWVMVVAVVAAIGVMLLTSEAISAFVHEHPTVKMLALSFLLLIGLSLLMEGFEVHIPKGYIYFAMGFSVFVELINLRLRAVTGRGKTVEIHGPYAEGAKHTSP